MLKSLLKLFTKPESVTSLTSTHNQAVKTLEEEYKQNKETLVDAFHLKLRSLLSSKLETITNLRTKVEKITVELDDEKNEVEAINNQLKVLEAVEDEEYTSSLKEKL